MTGYVSLVGIIVAGMMRSVGSTWRQVRSLAAWPVGFLVALVLGVLVLRTLGMDWASALVGAGGLLVAVVTLLVNNYAPVYFWWRRVRALTGRPLAPAWDVHVSLRSRLGADKRDDVVGSFRRKGWEASLEKPRSVVVTIDGTAVRMDWDHPVPDSDDWQVIARLRYPAVPYADSARQLSEHLLPTLERVESALEVVERRFSMTVTYAPGTNPFEGVLVRSSPGTAVSAFHVVLSAEQPETGSIEVTRTELTVSSSSRVAFEQAVERLLTLDGAWPAGVVAALR